MYDAAQSLRGVCDVHDDIRTAGGEYVASLRYFRWGILAILAIALTLVTMVAVIFGSFGIGRSGMGALAQEPIFFIVEDTESAPAGRSMRTSPSFTTSSSATAWRCRARSRFTASALNRYTV